VAADHAGRRAGDVEQNAVVRPPVPPVAGLEQVTCAHVRVEAEPGQVLAHAHEPGSGGIERGELDVGDALEHVAGLAARRRAGVEEALTRLRPQQLDRELRRSVLHGETALVESRERGDVRCRLEAERIRGERMAVCREARRLECRRALRHVRSTPVDPQPHWRMLVVGFEDGHRRFRAIMLERSNEPARVRGSRREIGVHRSEQRVPFALEPAQHRIDESGGAREAELPRGVDGLGDRSMRRGLARQELEEAHLEQRT
jgi:hypothetical protein